ncbi:MAG TPA: hypothetical protein VH813_03460 [Candidatus Limnocylindrales bacterium]
MATTVAAALVAAGCSLATQPTAKPVSTPTASPTPSRTASPTIAPSPKPETAAIAAFLDEVASGKLTYQAAFRGRVRAAGDRLTTKGSLSVAGPAYALVVDFTFPRRGTQHIEHRFVGGRGWLRSHGRWTRYSNFVAERSMSPFAAILDASDVTFLGVERGAGGTADRYRIQVPTGFFHPLLIPATNLTAEKIDRSRLELVIRADGVPVAGSSTVTGRGRVSGQLQEVVVEADLTFRNVGSRIVVRAP